MSDSLRPYGLLPARLLCPWDSPSKNPEVGCHVLLQGIFPTQGLKLHLVQLLHGGFFTTEQNPYMLLFSHSVMSDFL